MLIEKINNLLSCPDDSTKLILENSSLGCPLCKRKYAIVADDFLELLPFEFPSWDVGNHEPQKAEEAYSQEFKRHFSWNRAEDGWGDLSKAHAGTRGFYMSEVKKIVDLLDPSPDAFAIDVSGAVGNYSLVFSDKVKMMVNCDLHVPSIITAYTRRKNNMLCIRTPYLKLPFLSDAFDYAICSDTLIRGWHHEIKLLKEILRILKIGGKAFVDFHNLKWFAKNKNICAYNHASVKQLLSEAGIEQYSIYAFGYVPIRFVLGEALYPVLDNIFRLILPPKRHIVLLTKTKNS